MPDGRYELGSQMVTLKDGQARISDGNLAGAVSNLYTDMVNAIRFGIPKEEAIRAATIIPAKETGTEAEIGSLNAGKWADFLVCDREWNLKQVYLGGERIS
jgi:N-acetylglucosamine-6-phosphate deacetylase